MVGCSGRLRHRSRKSIAAQVVAIGGHRAVTVSSRIVRDNAVLKHHVLPLTLKTAPPLPPRAKFR